MRINESSRYNYIPVRQAEQPAAGQKRAGQNEVASGAAADTASALQQDSIAISAESKRRTGEKSPQNQYQTAEPDVKNANAQAESIGEAAEVLRKCLIIAARIISGDKVPRADRLYLLEHDPELYGKAITMRIARKDPRRYKQITDDERVKSKPDPALDPFKNGKSELLDTSNILDAATADNASGQTPAVQPDGTGSSA